MARYYAVELLRLFFGAFLADGGPPCRGDFLQVYDGRDHLGDALDVGDCLLFGS